MKAHEAFFLVEDSLDDKIDELYHCDQDVLEHFDLGKIFKSKSKYKGGFKKGKNTKEYNHDYYIHNKDKWKKDAEETQEMTLDELKELGLTDEEIEKLNLDVDSNGVFIVPTEWITNFIQGGKDAVDSFIDTVKDAFSSIFGKKEKSEEDPEEDPQMYNLPKSPYWDDPKTPEDPQNFPVYTTEFEDQSGRSNQTLDLDFDYVDYYDGFAIKDRPMSAVEDAAKVNPNYNPRSDDGYSNNCAWCSYVYDLRRRGYDVQAPYEFGLCGSEIASLYKDTSVKDYKSPKYYPDDGYSSTKNLFKDLESEGNGARGILSVAWTTGGGHAMAWEVIGGKAYVIDAQTNDVMDLDAFWNKRGYAIDWDYENRQKRAYSNFNFSEDFSKNLIGCGYLRTDNRELNTSGVLSKFDTIDAGISGGKVTVDVAETGESLSLKDLIVSYEVSDDTKQMWQSIHATTKHSKVKKKTKKRRKKTADEYRRS